LRRLNAEYKVKGLKIISVNIGENEKKVGTFVKQQGIDYTVLLDKDNTTADRYGVRGIPTNILLDKEGTVKYRGTRPPPEDLLP
jgi:peroxiredoxin